MILMLIQENKINLLAIIFICIKNIHIVYTQLTTLYNQGNVHVRYYIKTGQISLAASKLNSITFKLEVHISSEETPLN